MPKQLIPSAASKKKLLKAKKKHVKEMQKKHGRK
jgi:hypothetical protein